MNGPSTDPAYTPPAFRVNPTGFGAIRLWYRRHPVAWFLVAVVAAFASSPLEEQFRSGDLVEALRLTMVLLLGLPALGRRRQSMFLGLALVLPALVGKWVNHYRPDLAPPWVYLVPSILFVVFLVLHLLHFILRAPRVDSEVICAGVVGYLLIGLLWALAYILVGRLVPEAFVFSTGPESGHQMHGFTAVYFSFTTLCTVGYGDIVPLAGVARMLTTMEGMAGTFYVAILISRLVALYSSAAAAPQSASPTDLSFSQPPDSR
jgi:hypothetical protein